MRREIVEDVPEDADLVRAAGASTGEDHRDPARVDPLSEALIAMGAPCGRRAGQRGVLEEGQEGRALARRACAGVSHRIVDISVAP